MTSQQTTWTEYTGSDEQIAELENARYGYILKHYDNTESLILNRNQYKLIVGKFTHYWIIPDDPLRGMKIRHAQTGQPVWIRLKGYEKFSPAKYKEYWFDGEYSIVISTAPDWNIPNAEYSFTEFED